MSDAGQMHAIDIRWPIGALFSAMGLTLVIYGALHPSFGPVVPLRINLDVWWGLVLVLFGGLMLWGARRSDRRVRRQGPELSEEGETTGGKPSR